LLLLTFHRLLGEEGLGHVRTLNKTAAVGQPIGFDSILFMLLDDDIPGGTPIQESSNGAG
jgi:hypothetical protein